MVWFIGKNTETSKPHVLKKRESFFELGKDRNIIFDSDEQKAIISNKLLSIGYAKTSNYLLQEDLIPGIFENVVKLFNGDLVNTFRFFKAVSSGGVFNSKYFNTLYNIYAGNKTECGKLNATNMFDGDGKEISGWVAVMHNISAFNSPYGEHFLSLKTLEGKGLTKSQADKGVLLREMLASFAGSVADGIRKMPELRAQVKEKKHSGEKVSDIPRYGLFERLGDVASSAWNYGASGGLMNALRERNWVNSEAFAEGVKALVKTTLGIGETTVVGAVNGLIGSPVSDMVDPDNNKGHKREGSNGLSREEGKHFYKVSEKRQPTQQPAPQPLSFIGRFGRRMFGSCFGCAPQPQECREQRR